jgi:hypothetical protein
MHATRLCLIILVFASASSGQALLVCDFNGTEPSLHTPWVQVSYLEPNVSYSGWRLGSGAIATSGVNDAFAYYTIAGSTDSNLAEAIRDNEYLYFSLEPTAGTLNLNGKKVNFSIQRIDWFAPRRYAVFTNVDGFAEGDQLFTTASVGNGDYADNHHSFIMPPAGYDGLTRPVEFRIYGWEAKWGNHDTKLTAFSIEQAMPVHTLTITSGPGGTAASDPQGTYFEDGTAVKLLAYPEAGYHFTGWNGDITGLGNPHTVIVDSNITVTADFAVNPPPAMKVAINVAGTEDWSTEWDFVDAFKMARTWMTRRVGSYDWESGKQNEIPLDSNGWPTIVPFVASDGNSHFVHTITPAFVAGDYTVIVEGAGEIQFKNAASAHFYPAGGTNTYTITVPSGMQGPTALYVEIRQSSASDPIRDLRIIMPGFGTTYQSQPFQTLFLERLEPFAGIRYMDWQKTNNSPLSAWADRTTPAAYTQTREQGVALEHMAQLSNTLAGHIWICIPHQANDDYVRQAARLLRDSVDPNLKIYVEYSNETWNGMFEQTTYVQDRGEALGLDTNRWQAGQKYCSLRSVQIWEIFEEEFTDNSRLVKVIATQSAGIGATNLRFDALNDPVINPNYTMPDALAIAPYFGTIYTTADLPPNVPDYPTVDEILETVAPVKINEVRGHVIAQKQVADEQGCRLVCYEGGQHFVGTGGAVNDNTLTNILIAANRDARMYDRYIEYLNMLQAEGVNTSYLWLYVGKVSKWGSWGACEYQDQPIEQAPKYRAMVNWINAPGRGDFNVDGYVNLLDLQTFCNQWLTIGPEADFDDSNDVDFFDFSLFGWNWGL